ncbi:MAG: rRNA pseudouridine synthase [Nitrospirota bacterium]|nr:rRNA pseudouridine synthase [Nitrospirota bacterium]
MQERIQKLLSRAGIASRRQVEAWIAEGVVTVNGKVASLGDKADPACDHVKVRGRRVALRQEHKVHYLFYKPRGVLCTSEPDADRPTVVSFFSHLQQRLFTVGRLDLDSEGLIIVTNDGELAHKLMHPKGGIPKRYLVKTKGVPGERALALLVRGVPLEDGRTAPAEVKLLETTKTNAWLEVILHEGRYRQIRRMFDHVGHSVLKLRRVGYGFLTVGDLSPGDARTLTEAEIKRLDRMASGKERKPARPRRPTAAESPPKPKKKTRTRKGG